MDDTAKRKVGFCGREPEKKEGPFEWARKQKGTRGGREIESPSCKEEGSIVKGKTGWKSRQARINWERSKKRGAR